MVFFFFFGSFFEFSGVYYFRDKRIAYVFWTNINSNEVDIVLVPTGMYRTDTYTDIETITFHTDLNTSHTDQFRALPTGTGRTDRYRKKLFFVL